MKYYLLFAWRNLWRNKRRTLLAVSSIFFAVFLALAMRSMQNGQYEYMVKNTVSMYTGYLQVQGKSFWDNRSFDESFVAADSLFENLKRFNEITCVNPRIESAALISHKLETRVSPVLGINPESENNMTGLKKRLIKGSYLENNSNAVLITEGLAERLKVDVGDSIILFGQGYQGVTAAEQLAIQGIIRFPLPKMNNAMVFLSLSKAQQLYNAYNRLTSISLMINDVSHMKILQSELKNKIDTSLTVMNWEEMSPEIVQSIEADSASGVIMLLIFYIVIGFGVFGTIMMMTIERSREFGLLIALGMRRERMYILTVLESLFVSMTGAIAGIAISFPVLLYLYYNPIPLTGDLAKIYLAYGMEPIFPFSVNPGIFYSQAIVVFVIGIVTSLYPLFVIRKLKPVSALQGRGGVK